VKPAQRPHFIAPDRVRAWGAVLDPADLQGYAGEVDLFPTQVADLGGPQPVPVGEQDHVRVTMAVTVAPDGLDQRLDLVSCVRKVSGYK
jgi:hypothetical protein